jgi:glycosyltransferase involved in cell wall biosynthesis
VELESVDKVEVVSLKKRGTWDWLGFLYRLAHLIFEIKPNIVHGYLGGVNELALMGKMVGAKVVWGIRASNMDLSRYKGGWIATYVLRAGAWLSRFCDLIIVNSQAGQQYHCAHGYYGERMVVIPNGIDTDYFCSDRESGRRLRREWAVPEGAFLIGLVARLDPMKDHPNFLRAANVLAQARGDVRFVCVGSGPEPYLNDLRALSKTLGLQSRLIWAGGRTDMADVYNALDIVTLSSSFGEGFPNVIGEAMACRVPCVVTDVGDCKDVVAGTGLVVSPCNPAALAEAWEQLLTLNSADLWALGTAARKRIVQEFSSRKLAAVTAEALIRLVDRYA